MPTNKDTPATPTAFSKTWLNTLTPQLPKQPETQEQAARMEIEGYAALHGPQPDILVFRSGRKLSAGPSLGLQKLL